MWLLCGRADLEMAARTVSQIGEEAYTLVTFQGVVRYACAELAVGKGESVGAAAAAAAAAATDTDIESAGTAAYYSQGSSDGAASALEETFRSSLERKLSTEPSVATMRANVAAGRDVHSNLCCHCCRFLPQ